MRVCIPLEDRIVSGKTCHRPELELSVRSALFGRLKLAFVVDTGSDFSSIPLARIEEYGFSYETVDKGVEIQTTEGHAVGYPAHVEFDLFGRKSHWVCFLTKPANPPSAQSHPTLEGSRGLRLVSRTPTTIEEWQRRQLDSPRIPPCILGRHGFLDEYSIRIKNGYLTVSRGNILYQLGWAAKRWCGRFLRNED